MSMACLYPQAASVASIAEFCIRPFIIFDFAKFPVATKESQTSFNLSNYHSHTYKIAIIAVYNKNENVLCLIISIM